MDPVAHTLVGATLAETGLKRATPLATATLLIGANLPDVDALAGLMGRDASLAFRRGWTHGVLAMAVLPAVLAGVMVLWDRRVRRRRHPDAAPARAGPLLGLAYLGVLTHPFLDWLNTYGVRLLMPFDDRWFYGDALFIVDPWMWLLMAAPVVLARSRGRLGIAGWTLLGTAASALVLGVEHYVPTGAKVAWVAGVAAIVALRLRPPGALPAPRLAVGCLAALALYVGGMLGGSAAVRAHVAERLAAQGVPADRVLAGPVPADPLVREGVAASPTAYHRFRFDWRADEPYRPLGPPIPIAPPDPVVAAALKAPSVRGMAHWARFPIYEVERRPDGWRVTIRDLRYATPDQDHGFGVAVVDLDPDLRPR